MIYWHIHYFKIDSKLMHGHLHRIAGYTEYVIGTEKFHFHFYSGVSTYTDHTHYYSGITGLPVKTENGHYHKIQGLLESNGFHEHKFSGNTYEELTYTHGKETREAFGLR
ncbi:MAG TPA: YmaF family protein [Clostridiales bacterium]|nr:YmaF family protein [Clostridiales bacterium]